MCETPNIGSMAPRNHNQIKCSTPRSASIKGRPLATAAHFKGSAHSGSLIIGPFQTGLPITGAVDLLPIRSVDLPFPPCAPSVGYRTNPSRAIDPTGRCGGPGRCGGKCYFQENP
ncbi:hypothetical protein ZHAS_00008466 [Anopheles sinensis]|uniref:Uncharacterized protein n=1 Tax=Anopheles sinensis TaxID=74873 RepID=A0A084VSI0_ANOSI|nr:hypothetical protein ZHAS_00008466 [Anopheles sinensis]